MAPEQLEGKDTDSRTDIFAFGAVVYEMATGKKAFEGSSQASLIAAIMGQEPGEFNRGDHGAGAKVHVRATADDAAVAGACREEMSSQGAR